MPSTPSPQELAGAYNRLSESDRRLVAMLVLRLLRQQPAEGGAGARPMTLEDAEGYVAAIEPGTRASELDRFEAYASMLLWAVDAPVRQIEELRRRPTDYSACAPWRDFLKSRGAKFTHGSLVELLHDARAQAEAALERVYQDHASRLA